jgi:uncharacterized protein with von Willebrand factor type A (vWA) domain
LRGAGLAASVARTIVASDALALTGNAFPGAAYWALRHAFVLRKDDIPAFDRTFAAWFLTGDPVPADPLLETVESLRDRDGEGAAGKGRGWSPDELLRQKEFAALTSDELASLAESIAALAGSRPLRRSRRMRPGPGGRALDLRATVRAALRTGGDPALLETRVRRERPRRIVALCDVSGSMEPYSRPLLLFAHGLIRSGACVEAFAFGTRLTRLTGELAGRPAQAALEQASQEIADWAGGTRIGASLRAFNDVWGRRGLSRGAIVLIVSDGWEREDAGSVAREMERLARAAYAIVWVNPLTAEEGYEPLAGGMWAALPYVDSFLSGHNFDALEEVASVLVGIKRRRAS